jgi:AcrR family transcriptional regulator
MSPGQSTASSTRERIVAAAARLLAQGGREAVDEGGL